MRRAFDSFVICNGVTWWQGCVHVHLFLALYLFITFTLSVPHFTSFATFPIESETWRESVTVSVSERWSLLKHNPSKFLAPTTKLGMIHKTRSSMNGNNLVCFLCPVEFLFRKMCLIWLSNSRSNFSCFCFLGMKLFLLLWLYTGLLWLLVL